MTVPTRNGTVTTWQEFRNITSGSCKLLKELDNFSNSILVTGCQRSGTTMLSRIITESEGMVNYRFGHDDELDAALILSGLVKHRPQGRYCFQTTYIDECYAEYFEHSIPYKIIWVLRNPYSTVFSLAYNWPEWAFTPTFSRGPAPCLKGKDKWLFKLVGTRAFSRVKRACMIYNWKISQLFKLEAGFEPQKLMVVDYDALTSNKSKILPEIYAFAELDYKKEYEEKIHSNSVEKWQRLADTERDAVKHFCEPIYQKAKKLVYESKLAHVNS